MSNCYLVFEDGYLVCTTNHRNFKNCDLSEEDLDE